MKRSRSEEVDLSGIARASALLSRALRAVGQDPARQLEWLQRFSAQPLDTRVMRELVAAEAAMFCARQVGWSRQWAVVDAVDGRERLEFERSLPTLQRAVARLLAGLKGERAVWFPTAIGHGLAWLQRPARPPRIVILTRGRGLPQMLGAVVEFLTRVVERLRVCREPSGGCGQLFLFRRPQQRWCSARCGSRIRQTRFRQIHARRLADKRHARYERATRERMKLGPRVRVGRRAKGGLVLTRLTGGATRGDHVVGGSDRHLT
jgi:CGNR zinc finger protein